ncbi:MAG: TIGR04086 family membrane protein [Ruminococcus sp.]|nr:TIGR04086 family membrane protein [Ruminococcus sp.]
MSKILSDKNLMLKAIIIGVFSSVVIIAILMCVLSLIFLMSSSLPSEYLDYILLAIEAFGVLAGAYIAARILKRQGLVTGLCVSAIVLAAVLIAGFSGSTGTLTILTPIRAVILLLCGALAGIRGVNKKEKIRIK